MDTLPFQDLQDQIVLLLKPRPLKIKTTKSVQEKWLTQQEEEVLHLHHYTNSELKKLQDRLANRSKGSRELINTQQERLVSDDEAPVAYSDCLDFGHYDDPLLPIRGQCSFCRYRTLQEKRPLEGIRIYDLETRREHWRKELDAGPRWLIQCVSPEIGRETAMKRSDFWDGVRSTLRLEEELWESEADDEVSDLPMLMTRRRKPLRLSAIK